MLKLMHSAIFPSQLLPSAIHVLADDMCLNSVEKRQYWAAYRWLRQLENSDSAISSQDDLDIDGWNQYRDCAGDPFVELKTSFR